jgi:hypothetical protein
MLNQLENYHYQPDEAMVLHFMGYGDTGDVSEPILELVRDQMQAMHQFSDQWGATVEIPLTSVSKDKVILQKQNKTKDDDLIILRSRQLPKILRHCDYVVILLVTAGAQISSKSKLSQDQDPLTAFILDALGSAMVVELMQSLTRQVFDGAQQRDYGTTLRSGPGYTGWHIDDQAVLYSCFDGQTIPVLFEQDAMMRPQKTLLGLLGLRPNGKQAPEIEPCRICDLPDCRMRKFKFRGIPIT